MLCDCHELHGDGIPDLSMKFSRPDVDAILELSSVTPGALVELVVTGQLDDGCVFVARDCVRIVPPGARCIRPKHTALMTSSRGIAWSRRLIR